MSIAKPAPNEDVIELIEKVRDHYLGQFVDFARAERKRLGFGCAEVKFELTGDTNLYRKLYCTDFAGKTGDDAVYLDFQPDRHLTFKPFTFDARGLSVSVDELEWDDVVIRYDPRELRAHKLAKWFDYWFDPDDRRYQPDAAICRVIHSLFVEPGHVEVDFGTASAEAFWDMLDLLAGSGLSSVRVSSHRKDAV